MKIPKSFRLKKNLEEKTEEMIKSVESTTPNLQALLYCSKKYLQQAHKLTLSKELHEFAQELSKDIDYGKIEIEELVKKLGDESYDGIFLSALINQVIKENQTFVLEPKIKLLGIGTFLKQGNIIVKGDVGNYTGHWMEGGKITIYGNAGIKTGHMMCGGEITVYGISIEDFTVGQSGGRVRILEKKKTIHL